MSSRFITHLTIWEYVWRVCVCFYCNQLGVTRAWYANLGITSKCTGPMCSSLLSNKWFYRGVLNSLIICPIWASNRTQHNTIYIHGRVCVCAVLYVDAFGTNECRTQLPATPNWIREHQKHQKWFPLTILNGMPIYFRLEKQWHCIRIGVFLLFRPIRSSMCRCVSARARAHFMCIQQRAMWNTRIRND